MKKDLKQKYILQENEMLKLELKLLLGFKENWTSLQKNKGMESENYKENFFKFKENHDLVLEVEKDQKAMSLLRYLTNLRRFF